MKTHSLHCIEPLEARIAPASLTITAPTIVEGLGTHQITFLVTLDAASATIVTVHYSTADGTQPSPLDNAMVSDNDYDAASGTLTFNPGVLTQTFNVAIHGDTRFEHNEVFTASLDSPTGGATITTATANATILNDDPIPTISIGSASVLEGNNSNSPFFPFFPNYLNFTVSLSNASSETIVATASTADGTATVADNDYTATTTTLTFNPGETSKTFSVPVIGDTKSEIDETILANLAITSANAVPGALQATGTILNDDPILSITDAQVVEGALGSTTNMAFTVALSFAVPGQFVIVDYFTQDGTAVTTGTIAAGTRDYEPVHGTLGLIADASGHATGTIMVPVNGDGVAEANETFNLNLSNAKIINTDNTTSPIVLSKSIAVGTITDDDASLTVTGGSVVEGNLGDSSKTITFNVTLNAAAPGQVVHVDYATQDGTAVSTGSVTAGTSDYISQSGTLVLTADAGGHATMPVTVHVNGDGVVENNETFNVVLSNADGGITIQNGTAQGTIIDNDTNMLTISDVTVVEGDAGHADAVFVVSLTPGAQGPVTVHYQTVDGTAISGFPLPDYTAQSGTLVFTAGMTSQTIAVPILGDLVHEPTEMFTVKLSGVSSNASIAKDTGTGAILDNDPIPTISLAPASVVEGNAGDAHQLAFIATLSAPSQDVVTVDFATADGTATVTDNDYGAKTGTITFFPGSTTQTIFIDVTGDTKNEGNETMNVHLSNVQGAALTTTTATGTILNDDITASIANATFTEGDTNTPGTMTVTLSDAPLPGSTAVVNFALFGGSAGVGTDVKLHDQTITSLTFNAGETTKTINLDIIGDTTNEADESFTVTLTGATGAVIDPNHAWAIGTILDNDPLPKVSIGNAQVTEGDSGTSNMTFTVSLSAASGQTVMVNAATVDGTATAGSDYIALTGLFPFFGPGQTLTFQPGQTTQTVSVPIIGDTIDEQTETFQVQLSNPSNAVVDPVHGIGTGTILDNDLRAVSISDASIDEGNLGDTHHLTFTVSIPTAAAQDITVSYFTFDGTAKAGTDYVTKANDVVIPHGQTSTTFTVDVHGNNVPQANRSLVVKLDDPINATLAHAQGVGTIVDDEASYQLVAVVDTNVEDDVTTTPKTVVYKVVRSGSAAALAIPGSVTFTTLDGFGPNAATAGSDYIAKSGTLNFAAGQTEQTITVDLRKDLAHENSETFLVALTGSNSGVLRDDNGAVQPALARTATILDNDPLPTISINSPSVTEGNPGDSGETDLTFVVSLSAADQTQDVFLNFMTVDGIGENGAISTPNGSHPADFTAIGPSTLIIPAGALSASFVVHVNRDTISEGDETFTVQLSNPSGGETFATGGDTGTGTIKNDDAGPAISFAGANNGNLSLFEGKTGATTPATFTVQLSAPSEQTVTVDVGLGAHTATLGTDFTDRNVPKTLTFAPGETSKTFSYSILGDDQNEADETFAVVLFNAKRATLSTTATPHAMVTIKNDDPIPALAINSVSQFEGNSGTTDMIFKVTLTGQSDHAITVDYATSDAGAVSTGPSPDYQAVHGTLTFAPGETVKTIAVPINGDTIKEIDETFAVTLSNVSSNATIAQVLGGGTILDDGDTTLGIGILDSKVTEGDSGTKNASFNVQLSAPSAVPIQVDIATRNGTATAGSDYSAVHTTLTFAPGQLVQNVTVPIIGDTVFEATESYFVDATNATGGAQLLGSGEGRGTIYNDDIQTVNAHTVRYVDADGDLATVHISKGALTTTGQHPVLMFSAPDPIGGRTLQVIDFTGHRAAFDHTDLSVTAASQPGFSESGGQSDGQVNVGYIQGGIIAGSLLQIFDSIDFGQVTIEGDLGKIVAGSQVAAGPAVASLNILSHGAKGTATGAPDNVSALVGGAGRITDHGDWDGVLEAIGIGTGNIGNLIIKGALRGDATQGSGQIFFTGTLANATIGSIVGGAGSSSGTIFGNLTNDAALSSGSSIGKLHVLGDVTGGAGDDSGRVIAPNIGTVVIDGKLIGGTGAETGVIEGGIAGVGGVLGSVVVKGDVRGGTGPNSGEIFGASKIGSVVVGGSLAGGAGDDSASIVTQGAANSITVLHDITGGAGQRSGSVQIAKTLANFQIGASIFHPGDLIGGTGASSGTITTGRNLTGAGVIFGSIVGGTGTASAGVNIGGTLTALRIGMDLVGGSSGPEGPIDDPGTVILTSGGVVDPIIGVPDVNTSGFIAANRIGALVIGGDITSGTNDGTSVVGSGTIRVTGDIGALVVGRNINGNADVPVVIAAGGLGAADNQTIGALVVKGNTAYADILGGYGSGVSVDTPLGTPINPDAQMGTIRILGSVLATNVVAGVDAGADGRFGTDDDTVISGGLADKPAIHSRIAAFIVKGAVQTNTDAFGVVAQVVGAAKVGNFPLNLNPTKPDDEVLGAVDSDFLLHELPLA